MSVLNRKEQKELLQLCSKYIKATKTELLNHTKLYKKIDIFCSQHNINIIDAVQQAKLYFQKHPNSKFV
ncbi:hypothetical protein LCGC14_1774690 [marine sediment metagenome]|uniref:Uncharacterized protein n=1 Tax=marine sediment metagenome TaxID=412755 RepID=A0A0F9HJQ9_9ZZZZ